MSRWLPILPAVSAVVLLGGCGSPERNACLPGRITSYVSSAKELTYVNRVAFVELDDGEVYTQQSGPLTQAVAKALSDCRLFHIQVVGRDQQIIRDLGLDRPRRYTAEDMQRIREALGCDAVLLGRITNYQPHPHMQAGLYLALIDIRRGKMLWGVDHVWDTTDQEVVNRLKRFYHMEMRDGYGPAHWELALMSPKAFEKFVAFETAQTLMREANEIHHVPERGRWTPAGRGPGEESEKKIEEPIQVPSAAYDNVSEAY